MNDSEDLPGVKISSLSLSYPPAPALRPLTPHNGSPSPAMLPPPVAPVKNPLYLSIDAGVSKLKACVLDDKLRVVWVEHVKIDDELPQYSTRHGVYTLGDVVTCPSEARLHALDLLLEKLARECPDPTLLSRVVCVSGVGQPHTLHYLSHDFPSLLSTLIGSPQKRISAILTAQSAFSLPEPSTCGDTSALPQVRELEHHFGELVQGSSGGEGGVAAGAARERAPFETAALLEAGRQELARRTGSSPTSRSGAAHLLKAVQSDQATEAEGKEGVMSRTGRVVLESGLLASVFLGLLAPADAADACSTCLLDPATGLWDEDVLAFIAAGGQEGQQNESQTASLTQKLGTVERDGGIELGKISPYFVQRFAFSPNCIVAPFTGTDPATFLAFPLTSRDALVSLASPAETDTLMGPSPAFIPSPERAIVWHPAKAWWECLEDASAEGKEQASETEGETVQTPNFIAIVSSRDAGIGRALSRDLYCNGQWDVFSHLSAIVPHGGTLGLDEKFYSLFFPHGEATLAQGFLRFVSGARVQEFSDRKINPRLLLESQFMTLRLRLGRIYRSLLPLDDPSLARLRPHDPLGFPGLSSSFHPERVILVGEASQNPAMASLLSTMFNSPAFLPLATGLKSLAHGQRDYDRPERGDPASSRKKTTAAALGAAYKAAWAYARAAYGERSSFSSFLSYAIAEQSSHEHVHAVELDRAAASAVDPSLAGTFASSSMSTGDETSTSLAASEHSRFSLPRPGQSHRRVPPAAASSHSQQQSQWPARGPASSVAARSAPATLERVHPSQLAEVSLAVASGGGGRGGAEGRELDPDPPGLTLVAMPDWNEWRYYTSMLPEFVRLERSALKGLV
ncbi:uncharacterized protein JCM10292_001465 [Rhodotorula paludigena]|uniref:uncharacterized protein n=1 Tax=Rhodotorula paludigena TaxID=86838 RepID=UPI00317F3718